MEHDVGRRLEDAVAVVASTAAAVVMDEDDDDDVTDDRPGKEGRWVVVGGDDGELTRVRAREGAPAAAERDGALAAESDDPKVRSISHWFPYDRVGVVNAVS